jgi:hypothetical protein
MPHGAWLNRPPAHGPADSGLSPRESSPAYREAEPGAQGRALSGRSLPSPSELVADPKTRRPFEPARQAGVRVFRRLLEQAVIARALGDSIALCPAYVIELGDVDEVVGALGRAIDEIGAELRADPEGGLTI